MFVDVDGLKHLNDTLGHDQADEIIREIGERLSCTIRGEDFVGRFGGDEFIVIAEAMPDEEQAAALGHRLLDASRAPARYRFSVRHREHRDNAPGQRRSGCARGAAPGRQRHV